MMISYKGIIADNILEVKLKHREFSSIEYRKETHFLDKKLDIIHYRILAKMSKNLMFSDALFSRVIVDENASYVYLMT